MPQFSKPRARHSSKELGRRLARRAGFSVLAVTLFVVSAAGFAWHNIQSRIAWFNVDSILSEEDRPGTKPPDSYDGRAVNLLVLGTDSRSGDNNVDGSEGSDEVSVARSDTALVMHISADRKRVDAVSIPRDTLVDIPECTSLDGETTGAEEDGQFNSAFANGAGTGNDKKAVASGATCTLKTVEKMTGIRIDDFVVVDFNGLSKVVDSLGGVHVQVDEAIDDSEYTGLQLDEGCQKLDGQTALQYARVRHGVGDGSDISRISRQQKLMNAMASKALSSNVLTQSGFLTSTLETLTTSEHIGQIGNLSGLAYSVQGVGMDKINFITMPNESAADENRVIPTENAKTVWKALKDDKPVPADATAPATTETGTATDDSAASEETPEGAEDTEATTQSPQTQAPQTGSSSQQPAAKPNAQTCPA
ncbi:LCP family protein [Actinomyces sp. ZJ308]|uniref:LCP family glycopolymer transferase n=1 Tax=Actinomyces sp. ZJ308 TaxID=2708342 RepID=UPI001421DE8A|nr:LCP family protein [Actinomyces sp. ZJ308]